MADLNATDTGADLMAKYIKGHGGLARVLGRHTQTVQRWAALGEVPTITRIGRKVYYHVDDVRQWLESRRVDQHAS